MVRMTEKNFSKGEVSSMIRGLRDHGNSISDLRREKKELIILAYYAYVGNMSSNQSRELLSQKQGMMETLVYDIEQNTKYKVSYIVIPSMEDSKLECVFPASQEELELDLNKITEEKLLP